MQTLELVKTVNSVDFSDTIGKDHSKVLRDIRGMEEEMNELSSQAKFGSRDYIDKRGKTQPMYDLNNDQYLLLATKYSAALRVKLIKAWREAEDIVKDAVETNEFLIEDNFIKNYNGGKNKIILGFFRRILDNKGIDSFIPSIEYTVSKVNKDRKAKLLEDFRVTYSKLIKEQDGSFGVTNAVQINATQYTLEAKNREFSRRSASQTDRQQNKDYNALRNAKDVVTNAYVAMRPKWFTGKFEIEADEDQERIFIVDNEDINMGINTTSFVKDGEAIYYKSGTINFKDLSLYLNVTGGYDALILQTKTRDLEKAVYSAVVSLDLSDSTYQIVLTKLR